MRIALFITCLTDLFYPRVGVAVVRVLEHLGHEVTFPAGQTCCGQPMFNNGYHAEAAAIARRMIDVFSGERVIVTPSASCAAMVREHLPRLFGPGSADHHAAADLARRTFEFVEFMTRVLQVDLAALRLPVETQAVYHRACHLRSLGMSDEAVVLTSTVGNLRTLTPAQADQCCGFGGTFASAYPDISGSMVRAKVAALHATGADTVICNEAGCSMNIEGACRRADYSPRFVSTAEIIAEALGLLDSEIRT